MREPLYYIKATVKSTCSSGIDSKTIECKWNNEGQKAGNVRIYDTEIITKADVFFSRPSCPS